MPSSVHFLVRFPTAGSGKSALPRAHDFGRELAKGVRGGAGSGPLSPVLSRPSGSGTTVLTTAMFLADWLSACGQVSLLKSFMEILD